MVRAEKKILIDKLNELMFIFEVNTHNEEVVYIIEYGLFILHY